MATVEDSSDNFNWDRPPQVTGSSSKEKEEEEEEEEVQK